MGVLKNSVVGCCLAEKFDLSSRSGVLGLPQKSLQSSKALAQNGGSWACTLEERIDQLAAQLWGLTDKELAEIWRNKEENRV